MTKQDKESKGKGSKLIQMDTPGGIVGLLLGETETGLAAPELYEGLGLLQHRGQDACGIVTCGPKGRFYQMKGNGMVRDVLDPSALANLVGSMGIGHGKLAFLHVVLRNKLTGLLYTSYFQLDIPQLEAVKLPKHSRSTSTALMALSLLMWVLLAYLCSACLTDN